MHPSIRSHLLAVLTVLGLSLGSVGAARAASVTGAGWFLGTLTVVSAHSTAGGARGTVFFDDPDDDVTGDLFANVVDLYVAGNTAIVTSIITESTYPDFMGGYLYLLLLEDGPKVEYFSWVISGYLLPREYLLEILASLPSSSPPKILSHGHIVVKE